MSVKRVDRLWSALNRGQLAPERAESVFEALMAENARRQAEVNASFHQEGK